MGDERIESSSLDQLKSFEKPKEDQLLKSSETPEEVQTDELLPRKLLPQPPEIQRLAMWYAKQYIESIHPGLEDLERKAWLQNAFAAGFLKGFEQAFVEQDFG